jgi:hypothetical protein
VEDLMVAVPPLRGRGQADDIPCPDRREEPLERYGRDVVALVDDDVSVLADELVHGFSTDEALHHRDVDSAVRFPDVPADPPDLRGVQTEMQRELLDPLVEERLPMDEDEGRTGASRHEPGTDHRLPSAGRRDEDSGLVLEERVRRLGLAYGEPAPERQSDCIPVDALVVEVERDRVCGEQSAEILDASARQGHEARKLLGAADDPWREGRREAKVLLLEELGILKGRQSLDLVEERRVETLLLDEEPLSEDGVDLLGARTSNGSRTGLAGLRTPRTEDGVVLLVLYGPNARDEPVSLCLGRDRLDVAGRESPETGEECPLVRPGIEVRVEEDRVPVVPRTSLEGKRDQVAEAASGHRVLVGEESVVGLHGELVPPGHRLGEQERRHPSG